MSGKDKCKLLQSIRQQIATRYGLRYHPTPCNHKGPCTGTCAACDAEVVDLQKQLQQKGISELEVNEAICQRVKSFGEKLLNRSAHLKKNNPFDSYFFLGRPTFNGLDENDYLEIIKCHIVGWKKQHPERFWNKLYQGAELELIHLEKDKEDPYKIAVALRLQYNESSNRQRLQEDNHNHIIIGYLPRPACKFYTRLTKDQTELYWAELTTIREQGTSRERLQMSIYFKIPYF